MIVKEAGQVRLANTLDPFDADHTQTMFVAPTPKGSAADSLQCHHLQQGVAWLGTIHFAFDSRISFPVIPQKTLLISMCRRVPDFWLKVADIRVTNVMRWQLPVFGQPVCMNAFAHTPL